MFFQACKIYVYILLSNILNKENQNMFINLLLMDTDLFQPGDRNATPSSFITNLSDLNFLIKVLGLLESLFFLTCHYQFYDNQMSVIFFASFFNNSSETFAYKLCFINKWQAHPEKTIFVKDRCMSDR